MNVAMNDLALAIVAGSKSICGRNGCGDDYINENF